MFIDITNPLEADPETVELGGYTKLSLSVRSTGAAFQVKVRYSVARHWRVAFEEEGQRKKVVEADASIDSTAGVIVKEVKLVQDPTGTTDPESVRVTAIVRKVGSTHSQKTTTQVGIR